jgi:competence protein ComEC
MMLYTRIFLVLLLSTSLSKSTSPIERDRLYIWNVGQGSWSTVISPHRCLHFDMGGEFFVRHKALIQCRTKLNILFLSHLDSDHISFIPTGARMLRELCLAKIPTTPVSTPPSRHHSNFLNKQKFFLRKQKADQKKRKIVEILPLCESRILQNLRVKNIMFQRPSGLLKTPNDQSEIYTFLNRWLFTGDSSKKAEELWVPNIKSPIEFLVVGHHGSRTSTSELLIDHLPKMKMAIVSARRKKYRHPHHEVVELFKKNKTPLLLTEKWGHLMFEL